MLDIASLARMTGVPQTDLLALSPANDPFALHQPSRLRAAEWFAQVWEKFRFGAGVHIRRVHYRLVSTTSPLLRPDGSPYVNTTRCWQFLVNASRDARYLRLVPASAFVDRRNPDPITYFKNVTRGSLQINDYYGLLTPDEDDFPDMPSLGFYGEGYGPPVLVEIWCEKTSMNDILLPLARRYDTNLITGAGEMSLTAIGSFLERVRKARTPARILYISDFDPAGRSMPVAVARKIEFAVDGATDVGRIMLDPVVLTAPQCFAYNLPRTPIKESESRGQRFEQRFGAGATELDALEALHPGELERIISREIQRYIDPDGAYRFARAVDEYNDQLRRITADARSVYDDEIGELELEFSEIVAQFDGWRERAEPTFKAIAEDLRNRTIAPFEPPEPKEPDDPVAPLYDSHLDYLAQNERYRAWREGDEMVAE